MRPTQAAADDEASGVARFGHRSPPCLRVGSSCASGVSPDTSLPPAHRRIGHIPQPRCGWHLGLSVPGCRTLRPKAGPLLMQSAKTIGARRSGPRFQARYFSSSATWRSRSTMAPKSSKSTRRSRSSRSVPLSRRRASESRRAFGRGEQARQRRHDEVEAEVVQLARREQRRLARSRPCWRPARSIGSAAAIASSSSIDSGASTNTASTPTSRRPAPADRLVEPDRSASIGARGDVQVRAVIDRGAQLGEPLLTRHDLLAGHVPAALGPHLVFEEDAGRARRPPTARPCARRSAGCRSRCRRRRRPSSRCRARSTRRATSAISTWVR